MQQQFALAAWLMVELIGHLEFGDEPVDQPKLAILNRSIGIANIGAALAQGFDLRTQKLNPGLKRVNDRIIKPGATVIRHDLLIFHICPSGPNALGAWRPVRSACHRKSSVQNARMHHRIAHDLLGGVRNTHHRQTYFLGAKPKKACSIFNG